MMWYLVYIATVVSSYAQLGLMTTGPFDSEQKCSQYATDSWNSTNTFIEVPPKGPNANWFNSKHTVHYMESAAGQMGIYWSCVEVRDPKDIKYSIIENNMGGDESG